MKNGDDFDQIVYAIQKQVERKDKKNFSAKVLKEFNSPSNLGRLSEPDCIASITGQCGDTMEFSIRIQHGRINDIMFMTNGCGSSIACGSMTTRISKGMKIEDGMKLSHMDILNSLGGLPEENAHCAKLAVDTLNKALENYLKTEK